MKDQGGFSLSVNLKSLNLKSPFSIGPALSLPHQKLNYNGYKDC
jgi:hypothetical protein